jgi:4-aminobutyrate aminotransferase-like enzyme
MTSTHTGNPVCCAAALANLRVITERGLAANAASLGPVLETGLREIQARHPQVLGHYSCRGLVAGLQVVKPGRKEPDHDLAHRIVELCYQKGLLMFCPVGAWGQTIKIAPPLTITAEGVREGLTVLAEAVDEAIAERA